MSVRKQTKIWVTEQGKRIRICDLEDSHLLNIERFLRRKFDALITNAFSMPAPSGEIAEMYYEQELNALAESSVEDEYPIYENIALEIERRGLKVNKK